MPPAPPERQAARRRAAALAGHTADEPAARRAWTDPSPVVRATALGALARLGCLRPDDLAAARADSAPEVRVRAAELGAGAGPEALAGLVAALDDPDDRVVEAASHALGETGLAAAGSTAVAALARVGTAHGDPLCREAAVAALGSVGDPAGLAAVLQGLKDKPAVRRRAVLALAAFEGHEVDEALARALGDPDWQVRQAAEDMLGRGG